VSEPVQLDLFTDAALELNGRSFGKWMEELPDPADTCSVFPDFECRWDVSCDRDGCWRAECRLTGRPLFGTRDGA
jgi:hypothetical protein